MSSREIIKILPKDGWSLDRVKGSHHQLVHPKKPGTVMVPHPRKDITRQLEASIPKQAGLK